MTDLADPPRDTIIARLLPVGRDAEGMFSRIVDSVHLTEHHKQFIHAVPLDQSPAGSPLTSDYESDRPPLPRRDASPNKLWNGHYLLSTARPGDVKPSIGWRVGRGAARLKDRGVDLLVVCPDEHFHEVATVHALIQVHPESGVLMLRGVSDTRPVKYYLDKTILLYNKDKHVLFQRENRFSLGKLDFNLIYEDLNDEQYADHITIRNQSLEQDGKEVPSPRVFAIPRKAHVKVDDLILHDNISSGTFGLVCAAVEATTGAPVAMKETWIKHKQMLQDKSLKIEREVSTDFKVSTLKSISSSQAAAVTSCLSPRQPTLYPFPCSIFCILREHFVFVNVLSLSQRVSTGDAVMIQSLEICGVGCWVAQDDYIYQHRRLL